MKRTIALVAAALLTATPCITAMPAPLTAFAATSGICGENLTWVLNLDSGLLTLSGTGAMYDYKQNISGFVNTPWADHAEKIETVSLPDGITHIGNYAFRGCENLTAVTMPDSLVSIGESSFLGCYELKDLFIPEGVTEIGGYAFWQTEWLEQQEKINPLVIVNGILVAGYRAAGRVYVPNNVKGIAAHAFDGNIDITEVEIPSSVETMGEAVFQYCRSLETVNIGKNVRTLPDGTFFECSALVHVNLPDEMEVIGATAFKNCTKLQYLPMPYFATRIESAAFMGCTEMSEAVLYGDVRYVGLNAFANCEKLNSITIFNPECEIAEDGGKTYTLGISGYTVISGYDSSTAQEYAKKYGFTFFSNGDYYEEHRGDFDGDCAVMLEDVILAAEYFSASLLGIADPDSYDINVIDVNRDNVFDLTDVLCILEYYNDTQLLDMAITWDDIISPTEPV